jgi:sugar lactone lactonase YvrE
VALLPFLPLERLLLRTLYLSALFLGSLLIPGCAKINPFQEPPNYPVVDSVYPSSGIVGTQLRMYGSGFSFNTSQDTVSINGVMLRVDSPATSTVLLATIIHYTGTGKVDLKVNGQAVEGPVFTMDTTIIGQQVPYLTSVAPLSGWTDTLVTIRGIHFGTPTDPISVMFGNQPATLQKRTDTLLIVKAPALNGASGTTVPVSVIVINNVSNSISFTYVSTQPDPHIVSLTPSSGWTDTLVTVRGSHFGNDPDPITVLFGNFAATMKKRTDTLLQVTTPEIPVAMSQTLQVSVVVHNLVSNLLPFNYVSSSPANVIVSTVAGNGLAGTVDGPASSAEFDLPNYEAVDASGNIYVSDNYTQNIRKITPAGVVSTLAGTGHAGYINGPGASAEFFDPQGMVVDQHFNLYIADMGNNRIRKISPAGIVSTFAGSTPGAADGPDSSAQFREPFGLAIDGQGNIFVADTYNNLIRKITPAGVVTTVAGNGTAGYADGPALSAQFNYPFSLCLDLQGNIYVADTYNYRIRKITTSGMVSTLAGNDSQIFQDGTGTSAQFGFPTGIIIDGQGVLYVADQGSDRVRKITPAGEVTTLAGTGQSGWVDGPGPSAKFQYLYGVTFDLQGAIIVGDTGNHRIRKITIQ